MSQLLGSDIFCYKITFEEWDQVCYENQDLILPFNGSIFDIRSSYNAVFGDDKKKNVDLSDMNLSQNFDKL